MLRSTRGITAAAQESATPLVNLARLPIARVFTDGQRGVDSEKAFGVRNAFDGLSNFQGSAGFSTWLAAPNAFVIVRFTRPVTVTGVIVEGSRKSDMGSPGWYRVQIRSAGAQDLFLSPPVVFHSQRAIYATPRPVTGVREVVVAFQSDSPFGVNEIEIPGPAPAGALSPVTPMLDPDLVRETSSRRQNNEPAQEALIRRLASVEIATMRKARLDIHPDPKVQTANSAAAAEAWLQSNRAADRLSDLLGENRKLAVLARQASALGVKVKWCESRR